MSKVIRFKRQEDVRLEYRWTLRESDLQEFKDWMLDDKVAYPFVKDLTYEEVVEDIQKNLNFSGDIIKWHKKYYDGVTEYTETLFQVLEIYLRDRSIDADVFDTDYYDDNPEEEIFIDEEEDK